MKVIILINTLGAGGAERSMVEYAKFLHNKDHVQVKFLCLERRKIGLEQEVKETGIPIIFYEGKSNIFSKADFVNQVVSQEEPEIIHSVLTQANLVARIFSLKNKKKVKIIQSLVNTPYSLERKKDVKLPWYKFQIMKYLDLWTARFTPWVFYHAITKEVLNHYKSLFKIGNNYKIIYRGRFENNYVGKIEKSENFTIVNSGRQEFAKGQIDILKALKFLRDIYGISDIHFILLGRPGLYSEALENFIEENRISGQVEMAGFVNDVDKRLAAAHAFVFPSYYEGLGGALIEAFSAKLPCACSDIPVLKEVVGDQNGALFSAPGDYEKLGENILQLYKNHRLREKLSRHSFQRFQEAFRMEKINSEMLAMYSDVLTPQ